ncbi:MAG: hypothetical protein IPI97_14690 [Nitrosomonas sp.]|nr:hypothetical protein [Nitrosomonas sp.]
MKLPELIETVDMFYGPPLTVVSDCLRGFLRAAPYHKFIAADFSAIEARVLAWLAGEERVLEVFRGHGKIYEAEAAGIYRVNIKDVTKAQRQIGKVAVLALGFGGGVGAFQSMAKNYGVKVPDVQADEIKKAWRLNNPNIVKYWYGLEDAAKQAILRPGAKFYAGHKDRQVCYLFKGSFLWCKLPSGRVICYPYPKIEAKETPWGEMKDTITYVSEDSVTRVWDRQKTYGGSLSENVTQAVSSCLLREAMLRLEEKNYPIVMHVHDEIVCEVPEDFGSVSEMEQIMSEVPAWAKGLPISAEGWEGQRFRK